MAHDNYPRGASFGQQDDRRHAGTFDVEWIAAHGSRAQKREALRQLKRRAAEGNIDAAASLAYLERRL